MISIDSIESIIQFMKLVQFLAVYMQNFHRHRHYHVKFTQRSFQNKNFAILNGKFQNFLAVLKEN